MEGHARAGTRAGPELPGAWLARAAGGALVGLALAVTAACGGQAPAPHAPTARHAPAGNRSGGRQAESVGLILQQVKAAAGGLHSVRVSGRMSGASFDEFLSSPCQDMSTVAFGGVTVRLIRLGNALYFHADRAFYRKLGVPNAPLPGRWRATTVQEAARVNFPGHSLECMGEFLKLWSTTLPNGPSGATKHGIRTIGGQPVITLLDSRNDAVYVAATGPAYVLAIAFQGGNYVNFSGFNQPVSIGVPDSCPSRPAVTSGQVAVIC